MDLDLEGNSRDLTPKIVRHSSGSSEKYFTPLEEMPEKKKFEFDSPGIIEQEEGQATPVMTKKEIEERKPAEPVKQPRSIDDIKKQLGSTTGESGEVFKKDPVVHPLREKLASREGKNQERPRSCVVGGYLLPLIAVMIVMTNANVPSFPEKLSR